MASQNPRRLRVYIVGVRVKQLPPRCGVDKDDDHFHADEDNFEAGFDDIINVLKMEPAPLNAIVLPNDSPFVQAELDRRLSRHHGTGDESHAEIAKTSKDCNRLSLVFL